MKATIPVYVQTPTTDSSFFAEWPLTDLDAVIPLLNRWGITDSDGESLPEASSFGEFLVETRRVVFRVTIGGDA